MKKIDLLHTTILIVAILFGYSALQTLLGILNATIYISDVFYAQSGAAGAIIVPPLIQTGIYAIACIILVRNSKRIATFLLGNERPEYEEFLEEDESETTGDESADAMTAEDPETATAEDPDALEWHLDRRSILFALFIGIGLYTMIQYIPTLLNGLIVQFTGKASSGAWELVRPVHRDPLLLDVLRVTIGAFLIYAAPNLTNYIEKTIATRLHGTPKTT